MQKPELSRGVSETFRRLVTGGFHRPHVSPTVGRRGRCFPRFTERGLVLRIEFVLSLLFDGGARGGGVLFLGQCIRIFSGLSNLLGKRDSSEQQECKR